MADLSSVTDNYLPTASETFTDNLSSSIAAEAATVPVNSAIEYADGATVVLTVEPGTANEATFVGKKDVGNNQFIECIWTEGNTAVGHDSGATIIDYDSATHYNLLSAALQLIMNQDGTLKDTPIRTALGLSDASNDGWEVFPYTFSVASGYNKGNSEYELTVAGQDVTNLLSPGMRLRLERDVAAPTQCLDLEASSSQYAARASASLTGDLSTFTDDYTLEAWIKPESYHDGYVVSRRNVNTAGWSIIFNSDGTVSFTGHRIASNNRTVTSKRSIELNKWTHIAGSLDHSANSHAVYINGISVDFTNTVFGTITAIVQPSVDLVIGDRDGGGVYFDGEISDVRVWNDIRTATEIRDNMNQQLAGSETNLVGYWKLNGDLEDSTSSGNDLTGSGGAVATTVDNPMSDTQYAIVTKVAYGSPNSTVTVFTGNAHMIPNMTLDSPYYSVQKVPFGFPADRGKWYILSTYKQSMSTGSMGTADVVTDTGARLTVPTGAWRLAFSGQAQVSGSAAGTWSGVFGLSAATDSYTLPFTNVLLAYSSASTTAQGDWINNEAFIDISAQTIHYMVCAGTVNSVTANFGSSSSTKFSSIIAECAYV